mgnify:CR=1 FL=1
MHYASLSQNLETYLVIGAALFGLGLFGMAMRRTFIGMLIASELILCGASVNFMAFGRFSAPDTATGQIAALFVMAIAAAEAVIISFSAQAAVQSFVSAAGISPNIPISHL